MCEFKPPFIPYITHDVEDKKKINVSLNIDLSKTNISVIECMGCNSKQPIVKKKKSQHSKRKPTNASRYSYCNNKKFQKFVKEFMREQKNKARKSIDTY